jgi:soluble lytic murein transglycosylase
MGMTPGRSRRVGNTTGPSGRRFARAGFATAVLSLAATLIASAAVKISPEDPALDGIQVERRESGNPGAALAAAVAAWRAENWDLARELLTDVSARYPLIADYADLLLLRIALANDDPAQTAALAAAWDHSDSQLGAEVSEILANARAALGESEAARTAWQAAIAADSLAANHARLQLKLADSFAADGDSATALKSFLEVWTTHPTSPEAERAGAALDELATQRGSDPRTASHHRRRADAFFRHRNNEAALADYERAIALGTLGKSEARRAKRQRAHTLFRLRRYPEAVEAYGALPPAPEYLIERARAIARAGDPAAGARELEVIARNSKGRVSARALFLAGLLWDGEGKTERARNLFERVIGSAAGTSYANVALWNFGWSAYREGRIDEARQSFERLLSRDAKGVSALRARYWLARTREAQGELAAEAAFAEIAREYPLSYYGWRARLRVDDRALPREKSERTIDPGTEALGLDAMARPQILLEAGLEAEGRRELNRLYPQAKSLVDRLALSNLYANSGDFNRSQRLIVEEFSTTLARGPIPEQLEMWWYAWPAPFSEDMSRATNDGDWIEPGLVYALMREESGYRPRVVSTVGARGLLQIMPKTGEKLAQEVALATFDPEDLFDPTVNIRLGSHYLRTLLIRFDNQASAAIASYNAGPNAVARWIDPELDDDEWVEAIPYDQTRAYVKRVLRSLYAYRVLY